MTPFEWIISQAHGVQRRAKNLAREPLYTLAQQLRSALPKDMPGVMLGNDEQAKRAYLEESLGVLGAGSLRPFGKFARETELMGDYVYRGQKASSFHRNQQNSPVEFWTDSPYKALGYASDGGDEPGYFGMNSAVRVAERPSGPRVLEMPHQGNEHTNWTDIPMPITALRRLGMLSKEQARARYNQGIAQDRGELDSYAIRSNNMSKDVGFGDVPYQNVSTDDIARALSQSKRFDAVHIPTIRDWMATPGEYFSKFGSGTDPTYAHNYELGHLPDWFKSRENWPLNEDGFADAGDVYIAKRARERKMPMLEDIIEVDNKPTPKPQAPAPGSVAHLNQVATQMYDSVDPFGDFAKLSNALSTGKTKWNEVEPEDIYLLVDKGYWSADELPPEARKWVDAWMKQAGKTFSPQPVYANPKPKSERIDDLFDEYTNGTLDWTKLNAEESKELQAKIQEYGKP